MRLAEALVERADYNRRLLELRERIIRNALYQEGETPSEDPETLLSEYAAVSDALKDLVVKINLTNNAITLSNGTPMVEALAQRDVLKAQHSLYKSLAAEATPKQDRYSKKEIKYIAAVDVSETQSKADKLAKEYRELDSLVQQANWEFELK